MSSSPRYGPRVTSPFGESVLILRSIPSRLDIDLGCTLEDSQRRTIGSVRSVGGSGWRQPAQFVGGGDTASWVFQVVSADETPLLTIDRPRARRRSGMGERFELRDANDRYIGHLVQNNRYNAVFPTFDLESGGTALGQTTYDDNRIARQRAAIRDRTGRIISEITDQPTKNFNIGNVFYDYTLTFRQPPSEALGWLCLVAMFAEHFHRRTRHGGTLRGITTW
ncbi:hypothetical protein [Mycolicibacterium llatzerense]|uniref:hypothetical protein n=1 Tax=Mycolicibacterium llatzerense TaxID=280871 RepID=UPI0031D7D1BC